jgi:hypothetical protein
VDRILGLWSVTELAVGSALPCRWVSNLAAGSTNSGRPEVSRRGGIGGRRLGRRSAWVEGPASHESKTQGQERCDDPDHRRRRVVKIPRELHVFSNLISGKQQNQSLVVMSAAAESTLANAWRSASWPACSPAVSPAARLDSNESSALSAATRACCSRASLTVSESGA